MRFIPGRSFLKSCREPRPFFDKHAVALRQEVTRLPSRTEIAPSSPESTEWIGHRGQGLKEVGSLRIVKRPAKPLRKCPSLGTDLSLAKPQSPYKAFTISQQGSSTAQYGGVLQRSIPIDGDLLLARRPIKTASTALHNLVNERNSRSVQKLSRETRQFPCNLSPIQKEPLTKALRDRVVRPSSHIDAQKMHSHIQFLTTPTADTPGTALLLHFDDTRYLIGNMHEGTQRACIQRGQKLIKVSDIFLTGQTEWKNIGGLIGMVLTLADASAQAVVSAAAKRSKSVHGLVPPIVQPSLTIHGGPNITHTLATARRFVFRKGMPVEVDEYVEDDDQDTYDSNWEPSWSDSRIQVWAMAVSPSVDQEIPTTPTPQSPMKRNFHKFVEDRALQPGGFANSIVAYQKPSSSADKADQATRQSVVAEMFSSAWQHDSFIETTLRDVKMPAAIFTRNLESGKLERYSGPVPDGITPLPNIDVLVRKPWPGAMIGSLPSTKPSSISMSYVIRNHKQRGKFLPAKAKELRVPEGPLWSKLASGHSVQSMDGAMIEPEMVLEESKEGMGVAVIDLPSANYVDNLVDRPEWKVDRVMDGVGAIIWLLGPGVGQNERFREFVHKHPNLKHILSSQDHCHNYLAMDSSASAAIRLNQIDPFHYTVPFHHNVNISQPEESWVEADRPPNSTQAQRGYRIQTGPYFKLHTTDTIPDLDTTAVLQKTPVDVLQLAQAAQEEIASGSMASAAAEENLPSQDAEITCLGTGSALPSKYRNVSATLVRVPGYGSYLLDCGENTLGQLKRAFTPSELAEVLRDLKLIWISHLHADHHLGTVSVIKAWYEEVHGKEDFAKIPRKPSPAQPQPDHAQILREGKRLFVASHLGMLNWLQEYSSVEDYGYDQLINLNCFPAETASQFSRIDWGDQAVEFQSADSEM